jgi:hypothetical protein
MNVLNQKISMFLNRLTKALSDIVKEVTLLSEVSRFITENDLAPNVTTAVRMFTWNTEQWARNFYNYLYYAMEVKILWRGAYNRIIGRPLLDNGYASRSGFIHNDYKST